MGYHLHTIRFHSVGRILVLPSQWTCSRVSFLPWCDHTSLIDDNFDRTIRLPGDGGPAYGGDTGIVATLASVPWFLIGIAGIAWEWVTSNLESIPIGFRTRRGYRDLPVDEDAQILRFEDEE